jgi:hypothetical protein
MPSTKAPHPASRLAPLSIEQLEAGLQVLRDARTRRGVFWDENVTAFRLTVLFALRETSDLLLSPTIPPRWRAELEAQLEDLVQHLALADRYIERRPRLPATCQPH